MLLCNRFIVRAQAKQHLAHRTELCATLALLALQLHPLIIFLELGQAEFRLGEEVLAHVGDHVDGVGVSDAAVALEPNLKKCAGEGNGHREETKRAS